MSGNDADKDTSMTSADHVAPVASNKAASTEDEAESRRKKPKNNNNTTHLSQFQASFAAKPGGQPVSPQPGGPPPGPPATTVSYAIALAAPKKTPASPAKPSPAPAAEAP